MSGFTGGRLVVATHNAGKAAEFEALLLPLGIRCVSAGALGLPVPEETETSFEGNARLKALAAARASGLPALGDDSGIEVEALGGLPGLRTADWAEGPGGRDFGRAMARVQALLDARGAPEPRRARFVAALCLAWPHGHAETVRGEAAGRLVWPPRGEGGHGFDPMFLPDGHAETYAEMAPGVKNRISHRAAAFARLRAGPLAGTGATASPRRLLSTGSPFEAEMAYSRAVVQGDWCFVAGVTGYDYRTMTMPEGIAAQARNCFRTIAEVLAEAGFALTQVARVQYTVTAKALVPDLAPVLAEWLDGIRPASTMVIAGLVRPEMLVEIEVTAFRG